MANHSLVLKNTMFLYGRALLSMAIGLYTSRVVLQQLGVDDFGIFSVVGSLSMLFAYLNYGISSSVMRFMAIDIAAADPKALQKSFSSSLMGSAFIALLIVVLCETVGVYVLYRFIELPEGSRGAAMYVFQASIAVMVIEVFRICFQSLIIAHERMSFFAYVSVAESLLKLGIVFLLMLLPGPKLQIYATLLVCVSLLVLSFYFIYCRVKFPSVRARLAGGRERLREIFSFTGWNTLASFADLCYIQGSNIILNIFYGVAYNATMGITNQVKNAVYSFSRNLQTAANPHLTKEFSLGEFASFARLAEVISVVSYLLLYLFGLPILLNTGFILDFWLVNIPPDAATFIRLIIVFCLIDSLVGPLWVGMQAYGRIRRYQIIMSTGWLLSLPTMWVVLRLGGSPGSILVVQIVFNSVLLALRLAFGVKYCHISLGGYLRDVVGRLVLTSVAAGAIPFLLYCIISGPAACFFATTAASAVCVPLATLFIALRGSDRRKMYAFIKKKLSHG